MNPIPEEVLGLRVAVIRSTRRTAALHIIGSVLQVRVPDAAVDERVAAFLKRMRPWIRSKVAEIHRLTPHRSKELVSGETFPYLGRNYRLKVQEGHQVGVCLSGGYLRATVRPTEQGHQRAARIQQYLQSWYRTRALERLQEKTKRTAQEMGVTPAGVSVREFKSRWGSCDKRGKVAFNWRIIKAPHSIVDYVVLHELCHLVHPNHSKKFWELVARYDERYVEHKAWLNERGEMLL
jgi:predicted metal-dependent hydrolase